MPKPASSPKSFEAAVAELESIVQDMESGQLDLEDALGRYQRGVGLLKFCQEKLNGAEQRIRQLDGDELTELRLDLGQDGSQEPA